MNWDKVYTFLFRRCNSRMRGLKPGRGAHINRSHPLARGLVGCCIFNEEIGNNSLLGGFKSKEYRLGGSEAGDSLIRQGNYPKIYIISFDKEYIPRKAYRSVGWDCRARVSIPELNTLQRVQVQLGFKLLMPKDCHADIRPKSGLALKEGLTVLNSPGLIDWDYRGEVAALIVNLSEVGTKIDKGQNICQMTFSKDYQVIEIIDKNIYDKLEKEFPTKRGSGGFGSSRE